MSEDMPPHIVVLGGGSAGWITACLLHRELAPRGAEVTLVESTDIGIIGVGEGSTPQLKAFFDHLGVAEREWMQACDATYKLGIRFAGWSERPGYESYFHPFPGPVDLHTEPGFIRNCALKRRGFDVPAHPDDWFLAARLAEAKKSPHPSVTFPFPPSYGYHFDAYKLGAFLRNWGKREGIVHRDLRVDEVELGADGDVAALRCESGERLAGDLFVDCSGFVSLIAQQAHGVPFVSYADSLLNDAAVVMPTAHVSPAKPQTDSVAMEAGWRWRIPLTERVGNGYVYSSRFRSSDEAEAELRRSLGSSGDGIDARHLKMKVGRVRETWHGNCLAAGLAQGFIEPLEATALHIAIVTALEFAQAYGSAGFEPTHRETFNTRIARRYDGIRDYITAHYRLNRRTDTAYWREGAANDALSDELKAMMSAWFTHRDIAEAVAEIYGPASPYPAMSWHCLFAGYGTFPSDEKMQPPPPNAGPADAEAAYAMLSACLGNFSEYAIG
ncbi:tryptophan 7-halogenase [Erythrobacter litoralis]|uniref:tryptophan halogenase family protein n=1 Tax=Erythrobacter litoralis TaxID=39960 RepID=UPI002434BD98|nr:tryptophan 7-halogenase [Erythrobacter litoralis]MDG6077624.1 tryptophan 7-halogenase [Erythrobacter litoralis]